MEYYRHRYGVGGRLLEENKNAVPSESGETEPRHLTKPAQIALLAAVCILSFLYSLGLLGAVGFVLMPLTAAMIVLLAVDLGDSKAGLTLLLFVNILPFAASAIYTNSLPTALGALYPLATALPIWLTVRTGQGRAASVALAAMSLMVIMLAGFAVSVVNELGSFNAETVGMVLDAAFTPYGDYISGMTYEYNGETVNYFTAVDIDMMRYYFKAMFFGAAAAAMMVWAYFATLAFRFVAWIFGTSWMIPYGYRISMRVKMTQNGPEAEISHEPVQWRIELDGVTVGIYISAYLISVLLSSSNGVLLTLYTVVMNLVIILSPGFLYCGVRDIILGFRGKSSAGGMSRIVLILGVIMLFINPMSMVFILCTLGVIVTLRENRARRDLQKNRKE